MPMIYRGVAHSGAEYIRKRPECAALIGFIAAQWSQVELELAYYFCFFIFGVREPIKQDGGEYIAIDLIERTTGFQGKTALVLRAAQERFGADDPACKELAKILRKLDRLHSDRNYVVHGRWSLSDKHPKGLVWQGRVSERKMEVYEAADFERILQKISEAQRALAVHFRTKFQPRLKVLRNRTGDTISIQ